MKQHLPNLLTLLNLFCGCLALICLFYGRFPAAFGWFALGFIADAMDGRVARWLGAYSPLGKQLDSLADMVSFGVVPGMIFYVLLVRALDVPAPTDVVPEAVPGFVVTLFAALRLAKFNIDTRQSDTFIGLATPACTTFTAGLMLAYAYNPMGLASLVTEPVFLYGMIALLSYLMVAEIPMLNFRFAGSGWRGNEMRYLFVILLLPCLLIFREMFFLLVIPFYILCSIAHNLIFARADKASAKI